MFSGRLGRFSYFLCSLMIACAQFVVYASVNITREPIVVLMFGMIYLALIPVGISFGVRRLHDLDRGGTDILLGLIPFYNIYFWLILLFKPGTEGANQYGPDPIRRVRMDLSLPAGA